MILIFMLLFKAMQIEQNGLLQQEHVPHLEEFLSRMSQRAYQGSVLILKRNEITIKSMHIS